MSEYSRQGLKTNGQRRKCFCENGEILPQSALDFLGIFVQDYLRKNRIRGKLLGKCIGFL